jgi:hypothetical protein
MRALRSRGVTERVGVRAPVLDDLVELLQRPLVVLEVVEHPRHLVEGVAVDLVVLVLHREHALVELRAFSISPWSKKYSAKDR